MLHRDRRASTTTAAARDRLRRQVLAALERRGCDFSGEVQPRHRRLAQALEALDAGHRPPLRSAASEQA